MVLLCTGIIYWYLGMLNVLPVPQYWYLRAYNTAVVHSTTSSIYIFIYQVPRYIQY
eukprot:SAG11_NODE_2098_length_3827_cov_2.481223_4_plen_56_part_00